MSERSEQQNEYGQWVPAEPLPDPFGIVWERCWRHRLSLGQGRVRAFVGGWRDARAVSRVVRPGQENT